MNPEFPVLLGIMVILVWVVFMLGRILSALEALR